MRLIDADEAVRAVHDEFDECLVWDESGETTANEFENIILQIPTVDAEPVVRCKDCKFHLNSNEKCGLVDTRLHFYETDKVWTEDCFCAWGERREDER